MTASENSSLPNRLFGYLTFVGLPMLGTVGGLLIVDARARPIEFHCTSPVLPSRTQEILYGETLRSSLYCDQIGKSLLSQISVQPQLLIVDETTAVELRESDGAPIALAAEQTTETNLPLAVVEPFPFLVNQDDLANHDVRSALESKIGNWDWHEPFDRIRQAISEAHRAAA